MGARLRVTHPQAIFIGMWLAGSSSGSGCRSRNLDRSERWPYLPGSSTPRTPNVASFCSTRACVPWTLRTEAPHCKDVCQFRLTWPRLWKMLGLAPTGRHWLIRQWSNLGWSCRVSVCWVDDQTLRWSAALLSFLVDRNFDNSSHKGSRKFSSTLSTEC